MASTTRVALDTNMLLSINEQMVDIFPQIKQTLGLVSFVVPKQVLKELSEIEKKSAKAKKNVFVAKELMKKNAVKTVTINARNADEALLKLSPQMIVASNDKELKRAVIKNNGKVIFLRKNKFIEME